MAKPAVEVDLSPVEGSVYVRPVTADRFEKLFIRTDHIDPLVLWRELKRAVVAPSLGASEWVLMCALWPDEVWDKLWAAARLDARWRIGPNGKLIRCDVPR